MEFVDARRLTGPNAVFNGIGSILDVACTPEEADALLPVWADNVACMLEALDWPSAEFGSRKLAGGISLAFTAPVDQLYAASEINEWAWAASAFELGVSGEEPDFDEALAALVARHCAARIDAEYGAYDDQPLDEPDEWGDLASFRRAAAAS